MPFPRSACPFVVLAVAALAAGCGAAPAASATARATATATPSAASAEAQSPTPSAAASGSGGPGAASPVPPAMLGPTDGGLTLVEPLRQLSARQGSADITPAGALATLQDGDDHALHAVDCGANCGNPATWTATALDPGTPFDSPVIRARDDGTLVAVVRAVGGSQAGAAIGVCPAACGDPVSWHWSTIPLPGAAAGTRGASRYFALSGDAMILGLASDAPMGAMVCGGSCGQAASWTRVTFSDAACPSPSVAAGPDGAMAFGCVVAGGAGAASSAGQHVEVWSCPDACTTQASWSGVTGLASGDGLAADVAVGPSGMVGAAVNLGTQPDASRSNRLGWFQCQGGCGDASAWHGIVVGPESLYAQPVAAVTDPLGRSLVAYDGTSSSGAGLLAASCVSDCLKPASWSVALLDDGARIASQIAVPPPAGCTTVEWAPDNVTDIAMRGDWAVVTSGYSAFGTGGTCPADPIAAVAGAQPARSVVSLAVLGP